MLVQLGQRRAGPADGRWCGQPAHGRKIACSEKPLQFTNLVGVFGGQARQLVTGHLLRLPETFVIVRKGNFELAFQDAAHPGRRCFQALRQQLQVIKTCGV